MGYVAGGPFTGAPRFVHASRARPPLAHRQSDDAITDLPAPLAALAPHAEDLVLFKA